MKSAIKCCALTPSGRWFTRFGERYYRLQGEGLLKKRIGGYIRLKIQKDDLLDSGKVVITGIVSDLIQINKGGGGGYGGTYMW